MRGFYGLNNRFNNILSLHFEDDGLDFQSIFKQDFEIICHKYLLSLVNKIVSFRFSDDDNTPQQILSNLSNLTHLHLDECYYCSYDEKNVRNIVNIECGIFLNSLIVGWILL